jgi:hypothetical protein
MSIYMLQVTGILVKMNPYCQIADLFKEPFLYDQYLLPILTIIDHNADRGNALLTLNIKYCWEVGYVFQNIPDIVDKHWRIKSVLYC